MLFDTLEQYQEIKQDILNEIENLEPHSLISMDGKCSDRISKLDWHNCVDKHNRPWLNILKPHLFKKMNEIARECGYGDCLITEIWFQQYLKGDTHGWHTNGSNFTGVYYLELHQENGPVTEFIEPFGQDNSFTPENVKEGNIFVFPSFTLHRAPVIKSSKRKTIIAFNMNFRNPGQQFLKTFQEK